LLSIYFLFVIKKNDARGYTVLTQMLYPTRRRQLAQLGSATGVYKTLVKYLVGVPQVQSYLLLTSLLA
jgi:hypothetical protein